MIMYLEGKLKEIYDERLMLLVGGIGYDILVPAYVMNEIRRTKKAGEELAMYISFHQTERQPKPVLVGFKNELDKEFFELFISVEDIGPMAAVKALMRPIREIARFIEEKDIKALRQLKA
jgi:Holliday junction DNA helicase RuvA